MLHGSLAAKMSLKEAPSIPPGMAPKSKHERDGVSCVASHMELHAVLIMDKALDILHLYVSIQLLGLEDQPLSLLGTGETAQWYHGEEYIVLGVIG